MAIAATTVTEMAATIETMVITTYDIPNLMEMITTRKTNHNEVDTYVPTTLSLFVIKAVI